MQKLLMVVLGGIADHAVDGLGRRTPLQVAKTPNLDHIAMLGGCGVYHPTVVGEPVMPEYSLYIMLGNPPELYPGRAVFEALARGVKLKEGGIYFLAEPVFVEGEILVERRAFESDEEEADFFEFLRSKFRGGIYRLDKGLYLFESEDFVFCSHPGIVGGCVSDREEVKGLSRIPEEWSGNVKRIEKGLQPINRLLFFGCGKYHPCEGNPLPLDVAYYTDSTWFSGMVKWMGARCEYIDSSEGPGKWLFSVFERAVKRLETGAQGVFVYTDYIHRNNIQSRAWKRVEVIEDMDAAFAFLLDTVAKEDVLVVITSDITAPSLGFRPCSGLPVPVVMMGEGVRRGGVGRFDEAVAASGSLGMLKGKELLLTIFSYIGYFCCGF